MKKTTQRAALPLLLLCLGLALPGCNDALNRQETAASDAANAQASTRQNRTLAVQSGYQSPEGWRTECVGYHLVDLPGEIQAATEPPKSNSYEQIGGGQFSDALGVMQDSHDSGEFTVEISDATTRKEFMRHVYGNGKYSRSIHDDEVFEPAHIQRARRRIITLNEMLEDSIERAKSPKPPDLRIPPQYRRTPEQYVQDWRDKIKEVEQEIADWESIPETWVDKDTYYYAGWLWLWRAPRIYRLRMNQEGIPEGQTRQDATLALLKRFRPRAVGEIPAEAGFCVPYGFVQGVSAQPYASQTTLRMKNEPGLLFTVRFQTNRLTNAAAVLPAGPRGGEQVTEAVRIGPFDAGLYGRRTVPYREERLPNGRVRLELFDNGTPYWKERAAPQGEVYGLTASLPATENDPLLPAVQAQINAFAFNIDPQMKDRPAMPLAQSLPIIKQFLASIRLRAENAQALEALLPPASEEKGEVAAFSPISSRAIRPAPNKADISL
ncbi:MAG: hypothetical protein LBF51_09985 [Zoogloeaceae bacterium]|jgi:hypothetical protein|nr:hypothetical protein [Zoogloeaceae bacterium]